MPGRSGHFPHSLAIFLYVYCPSYTVFSSGSNGIVTAKAGLPLVRLFVLIFSAGLLLKHSTGRVVKFFLLLSCHLFLRRRMKTAAGVAKHGPRVHQLA
jgi:hypothetical protein